MIEKPYVFNNSEVKLVEKIIEDDHVAVNHMILAKNDRLPEHFANSHVYMIIVRGTMTLQLNEDAPHHYPAGNIVNIPYQTKMNVSNQQEDLLEFFVVKAPSPKSLR